MSTIQVDRIIPYQSSSVTIEGDVTVLGAATTGSNTFTGDQNIQGTITASIAEGFALVGGVGNISTLVATSSFGGGDGFPFTGDAVITGSLLVSGSSTFDITLEGRQLISGPTTGATTTPQLIVSASDFNTIYARTGTFIRDSRNRSYNTSISQGNVQVANDVESSITILTLDEPDYINDVELKLLVNSGSGIAFQDWDNVSAFDFQTWLSIAPNLGDSPDVRFLRNIQVTGSIDVTGELTASLQQGYVWVGDVNGRTTTVSTGSFGGGGAGFPFTGSAQITGSMGITGSLSGYVNTLSVDVDNTSSMNFNDGNFFILELTGGTVTHLTPSNIRPGQTINLLVKMDVGDPSDSGSLTFSPDFKFAGGFDYSPTAITGSQDLVSFVTFDTTQVFASQVKNLS